jgi:glycosyltransferase involved in cell wall biosynthesis
MNILFINKFHYLKSGCERHYFDLAEMLAKNGHKVKHFSMLHPNNFNSPDSPYFIDNIDFDNNNFLSPLKFIYNWQAAGNLKKLLKQEKVDIAHLHNIAHQLTPAIIRVLKKNNIPVVMTLHDYKLFCPNYQLFTRGKYCEKCISGNYFNCTSNKCIKDSTLKSLLGSIEAYINNKIFKFYEGVDQFIAPSQFMADMAERSGVPKDKIKVLYNFTNINDNFSQNNPGEYLLYFGRLSSEKGVEILIEAMSFVDSKLKIAGDGPDLEKLKNLVKIKNLENKVELVGQRNSQEIAGLVSNAKAVVIPSVWTENMPLSMLEAMAGGKVVLASDSGGMKEIINDGVNGYLFDSGNINDLALKINKVISNNGLKFIEDNAKKTIQEKCDPSRYLEKITNIYQSLTN